MHISLLKEHVSSESTSTEEEEVRKMIRECLDLRKIYVYRELVSPWKKETVVESSASDKNSDPFHFEPVEASAVSHFLLVHGANFLKIFFPLL
jgi:AMP deaminase